MLRKLFDLFVPGMAVDFSDPTFTHDKDWQDTVFYGYVKHKVSNCLGPRMAVSGWMSYFRGVVFWDPLHNLRAFGIAAWAGSRGLFHEEFGQFNLQLEACDKSAGAETKKASEKWLLRLRL